MTITLKEAFDKTELIWGIIKDLENRSDIRDLIPDIQNLLKEYHNILLSTTVEI